MPSGKGYGLQGHCTPCTVTAHRPSKCRNLDRPLSAALPALKEKCPIRQSTPRRLNPGQHQLTISSVRYATPRTPKSLLIRVSKAGDVAILRTVHVHCIYQHSDARRWQSAPHLQTCLPLHAFPPPINMQAPSFCVPSTGVRVFSAC